MSEERLWLALDDEGEPEIFTSIQGEGPSLGAPRTFIRLSGCNLHCKWCDTAYTWNWASTPFDHLTGEKFDPDQERVSVSIAEIAKKVAETSPMGIVLTGGEPLLQKSKLAPLIDAIKSECGPVWVEIETNGSIAPPIDLCRHVNQFNVSPKLAHSGNAAEIALKADVLKQYAALPAASFKFVIAEEIDIDQVRTLVRDFQISPQRVFLMPLGTTSEAIRERSLWMVGLCTRYGFRFTDRLHIHLFGDTRGT
ncbi:MAG: pyrroloquinoline quinone biosynthesis protein PqqE [Ponticaulis sp.]|nr:pyrroloquinoline quinone biosynthesis protein PqqE [Ponticaulis sp.]|tara:strand:+ start:19049 stop:19804 length:756 start_codon:yes stop_codon:yes gene_type:complete